MTSTRVWGSEANGRERVVPDHEVAIIGAGFGGIGAGVELTKRGVHDFVILEKWGAAGGTWHAVR